jgi:two-component system, cell cycle sensor histidine kinase and response regulator CckA
VIATVLLALSLPIVAAALFLNLQVVRRTRRALPWLSLATSILLLVFRLRAAVSPAPLDVAQEVRALVIAALALLTARSLGQWVDDLSQTRDERDTAQESYTALLHNLPIAAAVLDPQGGSRLLNPAQMAALTGSNLEETAPRRPWLDLIHADDRDRLEEALASARGGETSRVEVRLEHKSGAWRWAEVLLFPRRHATRVKGTNVLISDITERRLLDERLRDLQKMEALGAMAGGIAHDFNNLLGAIVGSVDLAERKVGPAHPAGNDLRRARNVALRAAEHTRQLLGFSRSSVARTQRFNPNEVCREAVDLLRPTLDPRIDMFFRPTIRLWDSSGDPGELVQAIVNLVVNARDALPDGGGWVTVETGNVTIDETYARAHPEARIGDYALITVSDSGAGIRPEVRARMFEPFFTTKPTGRGTGLGLAMVYGTVRRHGGWIQCYSETGRGTRFSVYLPRLVAAQAASDATPRREGSDVRGRETILLVEDDDTFRQIGTECLGELGYSVVAARDGMEAVETFAAIKDEVDLVILDLTMPRMNGRDALARLREIAPEVKVLVTSGHQGDQEVRDVMALGACGFIGKPYRLDGMGRAIRAALAAAPPLAASRR